MRWSQRCVAPGANTRVAERAAGVGVVDEPAERRRELRRDHLAEQVVVVVDGRGRDVDLGGPVGRVAAVGPAHELEALDEIPPPRVVVGVGVGVEAALEVRHHEHPAGEDRAGTRGSRPRSRGASSATVAAGSPATLLQPLGIAHEPAAPHRDALGEAEVHRAQQPRQVAADALEVHGVAELVQHRLGPALARRVVAEHAHVAGAVDVDAERVLHLARRAA